LVAATAGVGRAGSIHDLAAPMGAGVVRACREVRRELCWRWLRRLPRRRLLLPWPLRLPSLLLIVAWSLLGSIGISALVLLALVRLRLLRCVRRAGARPSVAPMQYNTRKIASREYAVHCVGRERVFPGVRGNCGLWVLPQSGKAGRTLPEGVRTRCCDAADRAHYRHTLGGRMGRPLRRAWGPWVGTGNRRKAWAPWASATATPSPQPQHPASRLGWGKGGSGGGGGPWEEGKEEPVLLHRCEKQGPGHTIIGRMLLKSAGAGARMSFNMV
jgi:hypothetical protein